MTYSYSLLTGMMALTLIGFSAEAKAIKCNGAYQVVKSYGEIATPYCEAEYLARVARSYGMRVSGAAIRRSVGRKTETCRFVGHDSRVSNICTQYRRDGCQKPFC